MIYLNDHYFAYEMIGEFRSDGPWQHPDRIIHSHELILVLQGTLFITEGEIEYEVSPGELLYLAPGKRHFGTKEVETPVSFYWFHFQTDLSIPLKHAFPKDPYDLKYLLKKLLHTTNRGTPPDAAADALGYLILKEALAEPKEEAGSILANEIKEYIRTHAATPLNVGAIAGHFGYHPDYLGRLFKKTFGVPLKKYLDLQRLAAAKDLLLTTNQPVRAIALTLGWRDENLFTKFFIYHEHETPTTFRSRYCKTHINHR